MDDEKLFPARKVLASWLDAKGIGYESAIDVGEEKLVDFVVDTPIKKTAIIFFYKGMENWSDFIMKVRDEYQYKVMKVMVGNLMEYSYEPDYLCTRLQFPEDVMKVRFLAHDYVLEPEKEMLLIFLDSGSLQTAEAAFEIPLSELEFHPEYVFAADKKYCINEVEDWEHYEGYFLH